MKIYTKGGDKGETSLVGGERVSKDSLRVESYGTVDELNSIIGIARAFHKEHGCKRDDCKKVEEELKMMQNNLLNIGSELATNISDDTDFKSFLSEKEITHLEEFIDHMTKELKPLTTFILPGGGKVASSLHHARTVCRRAERRVISLSKTAKVNSLILKYLNRLSDTLFTLARWEAQNHEEPEYYWEK